MVFFITVLRAIAACLITNAHYTGIYPTDVIANGGLIGDVIFFAISGYCLCNVRLSFPRWYGKRIWRIVLPVWIGTSAILLLGGYDWNSMNWFEWFVYPTYYHFVASIVFLYVPFYLAVTAHIRFKKSEVTCNLVPFIMVGTALIMLIVYVVLYDKSYYHIDVVREPFIRFLFFESMLLGAYFKQNDKIFRNRFSVWHVLGAVVALGLYFVSKLIFSKYDSFSELQIINQVLIYILLYFVFRVFIGLDDKLENIPILIKKVITFVAKITLEIYIVQYVLIEVLRPYFVFPLNWIVITASIIIAASLLHFVCSVIYRSIDALYMQISQKRKMV